ncbi:hypothetical protein K431DRAFT_274766 [Polychaeton citri CBS 116435]|uniref:Azaphilone pigments biosynthesis cluster protein L N-terminal domain-containing protein n=1 Tax=Polychaeton citri CBS 116435 TaxID=1314669 RepID=A0A9P4Q0T1_9PEZI|nr:hypothetical protein K431DRAFT_274766 [Polychaeton citri CBS 116435]
MAEIAGVVASGAGLISLSLQLVESVAKLRCLIQGLRNAPESLEEAVDEIEILAQILRQIEEDRVAHSSQPSPLINSCVLLCQRSTEKLVSRTQKLDQAMKRSRLGGRFVFILQEGELDKLCCALERAKSTLVIAHQMYLGYVCKVRYLQLTTMLTSSVSDREERLNIISFSTT